MGAQGMSPSSDNESNARKRVCKACDRCRLKKSKCDGSSPCTRCRSDNAICVFGERKKSHDKVYPKGYVEMLEQQQFQLVNGLQELYKRLINHQGWKGSLLDVSANGYPLTHDILERLDALRIDGHLDCDRFEENTEVLQRKLRAGGAVPMQRQLSTGSDSAQDHISLPDASSPKPLFNESFGPLGPHLPPTPPIHSPATGFTTSPTTYAEAELLMSTHMQPPQWAQPSITYDQNNGFLSPSPTSLYDESRHFQQQGNPCLPIPTWTEEDLNSFAYNNMEYINRNNIQSIR